MKLLIIHIAENFLHEFTNATYVNTFTQLRQRYEQYIDVGDKNQMMNSSNTSMKGECVRDYIATSKNLIYVEFCEFVVVDISQFNYLYLYIQVLIHQLVHYCQHQHQQHNVVPIGSNVKMTILMKMMM
jgi:hypothetical protein